MKRAGAWIVLVGDSRQLQPVGAVGGCQIAADRLPGIQMGKAVRSVEELVFVGAADGRERSKWKRRAKDREIVMTDLVNDVQQRLADRLDTRVHLVGFMKSAARGKIVIECADGDDLRRVVDLVDRG